MKLVLDFIAMIHDQVAELAREHQMFAAGAAHLRPTSHRQAAFHHPPHQ